MKNRKINQAITIKNETISRVVLILEIAVIILFHSLKSDPAPVHNMVAGFNQSGTVTNPPQPGFVLTGIKY